MDNENTDWQLTKHLIKERGKFLFESGKWSDCNFLIGNEMNQQIIPSHKLILAMASPVFEAMFFGGLPEKNDPIPILDVQPDAFKAILEYIYTDTISINSVDKACEICYGAKKYMLPFVVEQCTKFLWADLSPKNACRAYEFAKLFEEPLLMEKSLQIICTKTLEVLGDPSFKDIELNTLLEILDQDYLNIDSELDLFYGVTRYVEKHGENPDHCPRFLAQSSSQQSIGLAADEPNEEATDEKNVGSSNEVVCCSGASTSSSSSSNGVASSSKLCGRNTPFQNNMINYQQPTYRNAIKKIRFLTLTPQQFAEGPGRSNLLTQAEAFSILMNVSSPSNGYPMPDGFTSSRSLRFEKYCRPVADSLSPVIVEVVESNNEFRSNNPIPMDEGGRDLVETRKYYCVRSIRQQTECLNTSALDCSVTFNVDRSICITGVQVPTQVFGDTNMTNHGSVTSDRYSEIVYAHLLDSHGSRLTYTHCTPRVRFDSLMEISFDRPVFIRSHRVYKICVVFNKVGWYPMCTCVPTVTLDNVCFSFGVGAPNESVRDGLIRAIVFTYTRDGA